MIDIPWILTHGLFALIGAIGYIFFWRIKEIYEAGRHMVLAIVAGIIYALLRTEYGFPNLLVTIIVGWFAPDFIESIIERVKPKEE